MARNAESEVLLGFSGIVTVVTQSAAVIVFSLQHVDRWRRADDSDKRHNHSHELERLGNAECSGGVAEHFVARFSARDPGKHDELLRETNSSAVWVSGGREKLGGGGVWKREWDKVEGSGNCSQFRVRVFVQRVRGDLDVSIATVEIDECSADLREADN